MFNGKSVNQLIISIVSSSGTLVNSELILLKTPSVLQNGPNSTLTTANSCVPLMSAHNSL